MRVIQSLLLTKNPTAMQDKKKARTSGIIRIEDKDINPKYEGYIVLRIFSWQALMKLKTLGPVVLMPF